MKIESFGGFVHNEQLPRPVRNTESGEQARNILARYQQDGSWKPGTSLVLNVSQFAKYERHALQVRLQKLGMKVTVHLDPAGKVDNNDRYTGKVYIRRMTDSEWKEYNA